MLCFGRLFPSVLAINIICCVVFIIIIIISVIIIIVIVVFRIPFRYIVMPMMLTNSNLVLILSELFV